MHWKLKAAMQNLMGRLLPDLANPIYYRLQRSPGGLRYPSPVSRLAAGIEVVRRLHQLGHSAESAVFLEVGTRHQVNLPLSLWLCGASRTNAAAEAWLVASPSRAAGGNREVFPCLLCGFYPPRRKANRD